MQRQLWVLVWVLSGCVMTQPPVDVCADVACGEGRCVVDEGAPTCLCDEGQWSDGRCVAPNACDFVSCDGLVGSACAVKDGLARCECPNGALAHEGSCVAPNPCLPNPCTVVRRTTCEVVNGGASCVCDRGYTPEGTGCSAVPLWTCNTQHTGNGQDSAEPDECPPLASTLARSTAGERTILPAGDHDWFRVSPWVNEITWFTAESQSSTLGLFIDVFDETGTTLLASDTRGAQQAGVAYTSSTGAPVLVRVRALGDSTGGYSAKYVSLGTDDFADRSEDAQHVSAPITLNGSAQHTRDVDSIWLSIPGQKSFLLRFEGTTSKLEVQRDGVTVRTLRHGGFMIVTTPFDEEVLLAVRPDVPGERGDFTISVTLIGDDDHADDPSFGTHIDADSSWLAGETRNSTDIDSFAMPQRMGHRYIARWQTLSGSTVPSVDVSDATGVFLARSNFGASQVIWLANSNDDAWLQLKNGNSGFAASRYQLAVEDLGVDDHSDSIVGATPLTFSQPATGIITWSGDVDVFTFDATAGSILRIEANPRADEVLPTLSLFSPNAMLATGVRTVTAITNQTGRHRVDISTGTADVTHYTLTVSNLGVDDHGSTDATASPLPLDTWSSGQTQFVGDVDVFAAQVTAGVVYRLDFNHAAMTRQVTVKQNALGLVDSPLPSDAHFAPNVTGTVFIAVNSTDIGDFQLRLATVGTDDVGNVPSAAATVQPSTPRAATLEYGRDIDVFRIPAEARRVYSVSVSSSARVGRMTPAGVIEVAATTTSLTLARDTTGDLFVHVAAANQQTGNFQITVTPLGLDDHAGTTALASALTVGAQLSGATEFSGDVDTFTFTAPAQRHLRARCVTASGGCYVTVFDGAGWSVTGFEQIAFRAATAGTRFVSVLTEAPTTWSLVVTDLGVDDVGNSADDATVLQLDGVTRNYALEVEGDRDVFSLVLNAGDIVWVTASRETWVRTPTGSLTSTNNFRAAIAGTYFVEFFEESETIGGPYTVSAVLGSDDFGDTIATASPIASGVLLDGRNDFLNDLDYFSITSTAGQRIDVDATEFCRVRITTASGASLANGFQPITFLPVSNAPLFVIVGPCQLPTYTLLVTY